MFPPSPPGGDGTRRLPRCPADAEQSKFSRFCDSLFGASGRRLFHRIEGVGSPASLLSTAREVSREMRTARLIAIALLIVGCGSGPAGTPIVIYVTPPPASPAPGATAAPTTPVATAQPLATPVATRTVRPATPTPAARLDIEVVDQGFSIADGDMNYAVLLHNPNPAPGWAVRSLDVQIVFSDDSGPIQTETAFVTDLLPGVSTAVHGYVFDIEGRPDRLEVRFGTPDWAQADFIPGKFTFENVRTRQDNFGVTTKGNATSDFETRQEAAEIVAVYRDSSGAIIGGESTYIDFIDPGQEVTFEITGIVDLREVGSTEIYWAW